MQDKAEMHRIGNMSTYNRDLQVAQGHSIWLFRPLPYRLLQDDLPLARSPFRSAAKNLF